MTKEDWIKLATPVSISLLAMAIVSQPLVSNAFPSSIEVKQSWGDSWTIKNE
jgi:hypothetical protein